MSLDGSPHLLVVDDDQRLRRLLRRFLSEQGFSVTEAADAGEARRLLQGLDFDAIVLDVMLPGENGFDLMETLRPRLDTPILMLTAMGEAEDRIRGLELGADDYLVKPFEPRELVLRLRRILARVRRPEPEAVTVSLGRWTYDRSREELLLDGRRVHLTAAETALLQVLAERPGEVLTRETLADRTGLSGNLRAVDVQITRLRRKLGDDPREPRHLETVRGQGYRLRPDRQGP